MASESPINTSTASPRLRRVSQTSHDLDSDIGGVEFATYTVQIPSTPDNNPMSASMEYSTSQRVEDQFVSSSLFTGGYNCVTQAQLKEKVIESQTSHHPQMTGAKGSFCAVPGCDAKVVTDERGLDIVPCECDYKICMDCFRDAVRNGDHMCPGCKEPYRELDVTEYAVHNRKQYQQQMSKTERRMSLMKSTKVMGRQSSEFDHNKWLFETKGSYGYGNAIWPKVDVEGSQDGIGGDPMVFHDKQWRPLTRKLNISAAILSPYR